MNVSGGEVMTTGGMSGGDIGIGEGDGVDVCRVRAGG